MSVRIICRKHPSVSLEAVQEEVRRILATLPAPRVVDRVTVETSGAGLGPVELIFLITFASKLGPLAADAVGDVWKLILGGLKGKFGADAIEEVTPPERALPPRSKARRKAKPRAKATVRPKAKPRPKAKARAKTRPRAKR